MCCTCVCRNVVHPVLTDREREVLIHWLRSDSKHEAGAGLHITRSTVATHIDRIRRKYDDVGRPASSKALLAIRAVQDGLITIDDL